MKNYLQSMYVVRFSDCDPFGHLNNARYIDYFLNAREDHLRNNYQMNLADYYKMGQGWVVLQHDIRYLRPASFNERITIRSGLIAVGNDHLQVEMIMLDEHQQQVKALMHTTFVSVNTRTGKKQTHDEAFMNFVADKVIPGIPDPVPTAKERASYWQQELRPERTNVEI